MDYVLKDRYIRPMINIAYSIASLSFAEKKKVGAILLKDNRIIAQGFNGSVKGTDNTCEVEEKIEDYVYRCNNEGCATNHVDVEYFGEDESGDFCRFCKIGSIEEETIVTGTRLVTSPFVIHAEENAILQAAEQGISAKDTIMVCTDSPCQKCARMIAQCGIQTVYYERLHDLGEGIEFLIRNTNVKVFKINEDGETASEQFIETLKYNFGNKLELNDEQ